jgi:hypothetical protein
LSLRRAGATRERDGAPRVIPSEFAIKPFSQREIIDALREG